jgi:trehalose 6-phosphate phosphatase
MREELPEIRSDWALFLDIDGTLLDIAATPDSVIVPADLRADLGALHAAFGGAVALVSGRSIATIDRILAPLRLPVAGQHGAELRLEGTSTHMPAPPRLAAMTEALEAFAVLHPGVLIEHKGNSVCIHYRLAPEVQDAAGALAHELVAAEGGFELVPALMAFDIKPHAASKGRAVEWFLNQPPFRGRVPVFVGDDLTDEDAFAVVNARGGHSIRVGFGGDSEARFVAQSPSAVRAWLAGGIAQVTREEAVRE